MTTPYTYLAIHKPSGRRYYGVRYAQNCHPSDLWVTYFSSSKRIAELIKRDGLHSFHVEIRRIFNCKEDACQWETKVLRRMKVLNSELWLNAAISYAGNFRNKPGYSLSSETRQKQSESRKRLITEGHIKVGYKWTEEAKQRNRKPKTTEHAENISKVRKRMFAEGRLKTPTSGGHKQETIDKIKLAHQSMPVLECPHCKRRGKNNGMFRWHFDRCKSKLLSD